MTVKLMTEQHLEFLSFIGGCRGSSESTLVKMPHCWKSHALAQLLLLFSKIYLHLQSQYVSNGEFKPLSHQSSECSLGEPTASEKNEERRDARRTITSNSAATH